MSEIQIIADLLFQNKKDLSDLEYLNCMKLLHNVYNNKPKEKKCEEMECPICGEFYNPEYYPTYN
tara:strand:- start:525 stop:719 length:195 start_codon:yes stop_codon:yes gene_type:complete